MTFKKYIIIFTILGVLTLVWPFSYAYVADYHPEMNALADVLGIKSFVNGGLFFLWVCIGASHEFFAKGRW